MIFSQIQMLVKWYLIHRLPPWRELRAYKNDHSWQTWIFVHISPLSESTCKLLNRLGSERYAGGCERGTNRPTPNLHLSLKRRCTN